ncbi:hypothetical protein C8J45_11411 [Sphingomonas sp. PP-CE-3G-477]|uniref:hypothetical protein n=1 Tax=Sphingomonas sp. PP-CE-3G-477 TaxID=2135660 RepID=UPI000D3BDF49|nr:hypothetical protein [Sphingomonas sp. PP-CE-3G-477]PTQ59485.1 hypothetical protein C8J45_11411 [Sphingomonas sp. PP-CE-3G-477]
MKALALLTAAALTACSGPAPNTSSDGNMTSAGSVERKVAAPKPKAPDYTGRWIAVEGMVLDIAPTAAPGHYALTMQWDLDNKGKFDGIANGDTITFERNGVRETLRATNGDATGLKYLFGKTDCLTVKPGEGYCRDGLSR